MWIVAVAWVYVVGLMALTEPSIVAGIMTFVGYCAIPLSILFYVTGGKARRARRAAQESHSGGATGSASSSTSSNTDTDTDSDYKERGGADSDSSGGSDSGSSSSSNTSSSND